MLKKLLWGLSVLFEALLLYSYYDASERIIVYITVIILFVVINLLFLAFRPFLERKDNEHKNVTVSFIFYSAFTILLLIFSFFQFNFAVMPYDFFKSDPMYFSYQYSNLNDDIRIEYYATDYYGEEEIYRVSNDKNEIEEFLEFFRDIETINTFELSETPNVYMDWNNDIHVMLRNLDPDGENGYYIFSIDLVDTSIYAYSSNSAGGTLVYEVPEELRAFIISHLLME